MDEVDRLIQDFKSLESSDLLIQLAQFLFWMFFILFITWMVHKLINNTIEDNTMRYRTKKVVRLFSYTLILLLIVITFTGKTQYFTLAIGIISAGLAFALQEVILSVAGWIAIFSSDIYKTGDRIEINKVKGDVIDIGITKTTLMEIGEWVNSDHYSGRIVQVSNAFVFKSTVFNYSSNFPFVWDILNLPIRYGSDVQLANQLILHTAQNYLSEYAGFAREHWKRMVRKYLIESSNTAPELTVILTDNWMEFTLLYVVDYKKRRITKDRLYQDIYKAIEASEGKVRLASATHEIVNVPELKIELKDKNNISTNLKK